ncbi:MAG: SGNH/GDSL hydrolase family protein [Planctomycetota bacterium]
MFAIITNALLLCGAELALRATLSGDELRKAPPALEFVNADFGSGFPIERDDQLFWKIPPSSRLKDLGEVISSHGFRGPEFILKKPPGTRRVLCIGDSNTFGIGVFEDATYARRLERWLRMDGANWEVINAGCPGYTTYQMWKLLRLRGRDLAPDVIVVYAGAWNDYMPAIGGSDEENDAKMQRWQNARDAFGFGNLYLYKYAASWFVKKEPAAASNPASKPASQHSSSSTPSQHLSRSTPSQHLSSSTPSKRDDYARAFFTKKESPDGPRLTKDQFRRYLENIANEASLLGAKVIYVTAPLMEKTRKNFSESAEYANILKDVGSKPGRGVALAREALDDPNKPDATYFFDSVHPAALGHAEIAREIAGAMVQLGIDNIPTAPPNVITNLGVNLKELQPAALLQIGESLQKADAAAAAKEDPAQIVVPVPSRLQFDNITIPRQSSLILSLTSKPGDAAANGATTELLWKVELQESGAAEIKTVATQTVKYTNERWSPPTRLRVDLAEYADKKATLILSVSGKAFRASWGTAAVEAAR